MCCLLSSVKTGNSIPHNILPYFSYFDIHEFLSQPCYPRTVKTSLTGNAQLKTLCSPETPLCDGDREAQSLM